MANKQFRGIFGIPPTPFNLDETLDIKGLDSVLNFTVDAGAHGIVMPVMASEYQALDDGERHIIAERAVAISAGRVPVVAGVTGVSTAHSIALARHAQDSGADAVIAMPPHSRAPSRDEAIKFFGDLGSALSIPVFIQNHNLGYGLDAGTLIEVMRNSPNVDYVKEETKYAAQVSTQVIENAGGACKGVMGGSSGRWLPADFTRGQCGNMPSSHMADVLSAIWNKLEAGDLDGARADHNRVLPLISFELVYGVEAFKEILVRRGVIESATVRSPGRHGMDRHDLKELDRLLADISDLLTWRA
jgi:4-hydroxy-tetrahydrodipicolinate synthase